LEFVNKIKGAALRAEKAEEARQLHFYDFAPKNAKETKIRKDNCE